MYNVYKICTREGKAHIPSLALGVGDIWGEYDPGVFSIQRTPLPAFFEAYEVEIVPVNTENPVNNAGERLVTERVLDPLSQDLFDELGRYTQKFAVPFQATVFPGCYSIEVTGITSEQHRAVPCKYLLRVD